MKQHDARDDQDSLRCILHPWRTGGSVGRTIYVVLGKGGEEHARDEEHDQLIGTMDTAQIAEAAVVAHNEWLKKHKRANR